MNTMMIMAQAGGQGGAGGGMNMNNLMIMLLLMAALMYFMIFRPQRRKEKERATMIAELRAGERIMFAGGLIGTVTEVREHTFLVEVANKVNIEIARAAVGRVLAKDEAPTLEERK